MKARKGHCLKKGTVPLRHLRNTSVLRRTPRDNPRFQTVADESRGLSPFPSERSLVRLSTENRPSMSRSWFTLREGNGERSASSWRGGADGPVGRRELPGAGAGAQGDLL